MSTVAAPPLDLTEHIFRSVRGWLHGLYPDTDIYIERKQVADDPARPAVRMEMVAGPGWVELSAGANYLTTTIKIAYAADAANAGSWDAMRFVGKLRAACVRPAGRIPLYLYNFAWPRQPDVEVDGVAGGTLPLAIDVSVVAVAADGTASAPSEPLPLVVPAGNVLAVTARQWPAGDGIAESWRYYAAATGDPLTLQGTADDGDAFELSEIVEGAAPPSNQRLAFKGLRVDSFDANLVETLGSEGNFDATATLRLRALVPRSWAAQLDDVLIP